MPRNKGFTLIELIVVILLITVMSIALLPSWYGAPLNLEYQARQVLQDIRYAQALSMTSGQRYRWVLLTSSAYQITNEAGTPVLLPSGGTQLVLSSGVTLGLTNLPNNLIAFDSQGVPYITSTYPGTLLAAAAATITLSTGSYSHAIQISPQTGYGALL